jgi:hypothetical protein
LAKKFAFLTQIKAMQSYANIFIITLVFEKDANFFAENGQKSHKIVIITSTPGANPTIESYNASVVNFYNAMGSLVHF